MTWSSLQTCPFFIVGGKGGAEAKIAALRHAGVDVSKSPAQMGVMIKSALERKAAAAAAYNWAATAYNRPYYQVKMHRLIIYIIVFVYSTTLKKELCQLEW